MSDKLLCEPIALDDFADGLTPSSTPRAPRLSLNPDDVKNGLARLVLTLIELLRELLERQAIRRMESGSLNENEIERLGSTFLQLAQQMERLRKEFGLEQADLNIDLGPLGNLL